MGKVSVFSTMAADVNYTDWIAGADAAAMKAQGRSIHIKGGAGVANDRIVTPMGICTEIDDADLEVLKRNFVFLQHEKAGFVKVMKKAADPEKVAADMNRADPSAPKTPADYEGKNDSEAKPTETA